MRNLSATLLAAQQASSRIPYVKVEAKNRIAGVVRLDWTRSYTGTEDDYFHALTMPADGSLIRVRITAPADNRKLYRQKVTSPGPGSDFSNWTYTNQYDCLAVAAASLGPEVSIFWINGSREVRHIKSADYGANWRSPELIDYSPTTAVGGLAAAYRPGGDLAIFFADQATLYVKKRVGGNWQAKAAWDKTTGNLSGIAAVYDSDFNLVVSGQDTEGNFKLWSLVYGDGGDVSLDAWSEVREFASAPSDGNFEYGSPFLDKPDVFRCFYVEKFSGTEAYSRPLWSHTVSGSRFLDNLWREPVPFNLSTDFSLAVAHYGDYCWLTNQSGVWQAGLTEASLDLTADVISLKQEITEQQGQATIELRNDDGRYVSLPTPLGIGCQLEVSPGYVTSQGIEVSSGLAFILEGYEYTSFGGKASLLLHARDGWDWPENWRARHQFRWNKSWAELNVRQLLEFVLSRAGLRLEVKSESSVITGYYPDFSVYFGDSGDAVIRKLLSFVPDVLFIEGNKAYLFNPLSSDDSSYSYGAAHPILEGRFLKRAWQINRVQIEGYDTQGNQPIVVDSFSWSQLDKLYDRLIRLEDRNITSVIEAEGRGNTYLREAEIASGGDSIRVPVNCGQQLYDVIDITDSRAGLIAEKRRVLGIVMVYNPFRGEYEQKLALGAV